MLKKISLLWASIALASYAQEKKVEHLWLGNLSLPTSQMPAPLFSFGQLIVDKGDVTAYSMVNYLKGCDRKFVEVIPSVLYGACENCAVYLNVPIAAKFKENNFCSSGIEDIFVQFEYAYHNKETLRYLNQASIFTSISLPTGSWKKNPSTGLGSPSFFLGTTASHLGIDWYFFASSGVLLPTKYHNNKPGTQFLYQWGIGKNLAYSAHCWILSVILEFDGTYSKRNKINGAIDLNSGGNTLFIGPSLFFSTKRFVAQGGIALPLSQHLCGQQTKDTYFISAYIGWKFN